MNCLNTSAWRGCVSEVSLVFFIPAKVRFLIPSECRACDFDHRQRWRVELPSSFVIRRVAIFLSRLAACRHRDVNFWAFVSPKMQNDLESGWCSCELCVCSFRDTDRSLKIPRFTFTELQWNLLFYFQVPIQGAWFDTSLRLHIVWWVLSVHSSALFRSLLICERWLLSTAAERINQPTAGWLTKTGQLTFDTELRCLLWLWVWAVMDVWVQLRVSFMAQSVVWLKCDSQFQNSALV